MDAMLINQLAPQTGQKPLPAFHAYGIEMEYMIVDRATLDVRPIADRLMQAVTGGYACEVERGALGWSNELVLHVLEIKNPRPQQLETLPRAFQQEVAEINARLAAFDALLMPSAMHPWMAPERETQLWPHDNQAIYQAYHRIFDCHRHGWANLQSMHVNLPFADDAEFERLHAAIRLALPILPAIAASSPIADGRLTGFMDYRMRVYRDNAAQFPMITGLVVPEIVRNAREHDASILEPMYAAINPHDQDKILQREWLNSRGAIPRFDRNAIEIRVLDMQEHPAADLALAALVIDLVAALYDGAFAALEAQQQLSTEALAEILWQCVAEADQAVIVNGAYLELFGCRAASATAAELWQAIAETLTARGCAHSALWRDTFAVIQQKGPLARRIVRALDGDTSRESMQRVYRELADCLVRGSAFIA